MSGDEPSKPRGRCPICGAPPDVHYRPFCSRRCADVDLSRWLRGVYAIPAESAEADASGSGEDDERKGPNGAGQRDQHDI